MQLGRNGIEIGDTQKLPKISALSTTCIAVKNISPDSTGLPKEK